LPRQTFAAWQQASSASQQAAPGWQQSAAPCFNKEVTLVLAGQQAAPGSQQGASGEQQLPEAISGACPAPVLPAKIATPKILSAATDSAKNRIDMDVLPKFEEKFAEKPLDVSHGNGPSAGSTLAIAADDQIPFRQRDQPSEGEEAAAPPGIAECHPQ
jgi:hypothetical protein